MTTSPQPCSKDDFHRERSRFLDAFAGLEEALHSKPISGADKSTAELLKTLRAIRNDLVHSQMRFTPLDGKLHAVVINTENVGKVARQSRVVALDDFKVLGSQIGQVKKALA
mgnify:CR=1 FL=1